MKMNRKMIRAISLAMVGTMTTATPAYADNFGVSFAGIAGFLRTERAAQQATVGVAASNYTDGYMNAIKVLASTNVKYEMTEEEVEAQVELAENIDAAAEEEKKTSPYDNVAIAQVRSCVNVRTEATEDSEVVGKIFNNAAATILDTVETDDEGTWYEIVSGNVEGYTKANYFVTGEDAEAIAYEVGEVKATVTAESLRLRSKASTESSIVTVLNEDERYDVMSQEGDFTRLRIDSDLTGYVASDYIDIKVDFEHAVTIEELREAEEAQRRAEESIAESIAAEEAEEAEEEAEEDAEEEAEEEAREAEEEEEEEEEKEEAREEAEEEAEEEEEEETEAPKKSRSSSGLRQDIVDYACSFVGAIPYVWGGNSLSTGVDCSGFVQQVYKHFGISLPRTSSSQGSAGHSVSSADKQPGDLVHYSGHIAIYIGDGKVVHASNERTGIKISTWNYRSYNSIRNVID